MRRELNALGYTEGINIQLVWKVAPQGYEQLKSLVDDLVRDNVNIIVAGGDAPSRAAMQATSSIPLVFASGDPILGGYARTLAHPGTNATGVYVPSPELEAKRLELLLELSPRPGRIAYVRNPDNPLPVKMTEFARKAAREHRIKLTIIDVSRGSEIGPALKPISRKSTDAVLVSPDLILASHHQASSLQIEVPQSLLARANETLR